MRRPPITPTRGVASRCTLGGWACQADPRERLREHTSGCWPRISPAEASLQCRCRGEEELRAGNLPDGVNPLLLLVLVLGALTVLLVLGWARARSVCTRGLRCCWFALVSSSPLRFPCTVTR